MYGIRTVQQGYNTIQYDTTDDNIHTPSILSEKEKGIKDVCVCVCVCEREREREKRMKHTAHDAIDSILRVSTVYIVQYT